MKHELPCLWVSGHMTLQGQRQQAQDTDGEALQSVVPWLNREGPDHGGKETQDNVS